VTRIAVHAVAEAEGGHGDGGLANDGFWSVVTILVAPDAVELRIVSMRAVDFRVSTYHLTTTNDRHQAEGLHTLALRVELALTSNVSKHHVRMHESIQVLYSLVV
jgi:hypothetical protein